MSITAIEYKLLRDMKDAGFLPEKPHVLEFGEANWYGDLPIAQLEEDIGLFVTDADERASLIEALRRHWAKVETDDFTDELFHIAKIFYRVTLEPASTTAIDFDGTAEAIRHDLNTPLDLGRQFDVTLNFGTGEHIFNAYQFFKTVHDTTRPGGVMMHGMPFHGWVDHGFYCLQPTFYFDLAAANGYQLRALVYAEITPLRIVQIKSREQIADMVERNQIGRNAMLYAVMIRPEPGEDFKVPMQGYYARTISDRAREAWSMLR